MKQTICSTFTINVICIVIFFSNTFSQSYFRSGMFLHHSTGNYIWGPNPDGNSTTTIPAQMHLFNINHSYRGSDSISMDQEWWAPSDNEWSTQHEFFESNTTYTDINYYLSNFKILIVKSCFPSSEIDSWGSDSDTLNPTYKSVYNYKWHWRHILTVMKNNPANFFVIWTNAPLEVNSTNLVQASLAKSFCRWAKDTLAAGLDPVFGAFPHNVYVFDYFSKVSGSNGIELAQYATGSGDSHPNGAATDLVAPQFVNEIFTAAMAYESFYTGIKTSPLKPVALCFPNPAGNSISFKMTGCTSGSLAIYDALGNRLEQIDGVNNDVSSRFNVRLDEFPNGIYFYRFSIGNEIYRGKFIKK